MCVVKLSRVQKDSSSNWVTSVDYHRNTSFSKAFASFISLLDIQCRSLERTELVPYRIEELLGVPGVDLTSL